MLNFRSIRAQRSLLRIPGGTWRYYAGFAIGRVAGLIVLPITSRALGVNGFGRFEAAFAVFIAATIVLDAGQGAAIVRFVGDKDHSTADVLRAAAIIQIFASLFAVVCLAPPLLLFAAPHDRPELLLLALIVFALVEGFAVVGGGLLRATGRDGLFAVFSVCRLVLTASIGIVGALSLGASGALLGIALGGTAFAVFAVREVLRAASGKARQELRTLAQYGVPLIATTAAYWTLALSDRLFLRGLAPDQILGTYAANYRLGSVLLIFVAAPLGLTWVPAARKALARGGVDDLRRQWSARYALTCAAGTLALLVIGERAIPIAFGARFDFDRIVVAAAAVSAWFAGFYLFLVTPILLSKQTRRLAVISVAVVAVNLVANALLIPPLGAHGAASATVISYASLCLGGLVACPRPRLAWALHPRHLGVLAASAGAVAIGATQETAGIACLCALLAVAGALGLKATRNGSVIPRQVASPIGNDSHHRTTEPT